jgi:lipopolysaccharide export LptBFGC system permease protein LptF
MSAVRSTAAWLRRPKLWDDVFTRTLANVLSVAILAAVAAGVGLFHLTRQQWLRVSDVVIVILAFVFLELLGQRRTRREAFKVVIAVVVVAIVAVLGMQVWLVGFAGLGPF